VLFTIVIYICISWVKIFSWHQIKVISVKWLKCYSIFIINNNRLGHWQTIASLVRLLFKKIFSRWILGLICKFWRLDIRKSKLIVDWIVFHKKHGWTVINLSCFSLGLFRARVLLIWYYTIWHKIVNTGLILKYLSLLGCRWIFCCLGKVCGNIVNRNSNLSSTWDSLLFFSNLLNRILLKLLLNFMFLSGWLSCCLINLLLLTEITSLFSIVFKSDCTVWSWLFLFITLL